MVNSFCETQLGLFSIALRKPHPQRDMFPTEEKKQEQEQDPFSFLFFFRGEHFLAQHLFLYQQKDLKTGPA